MPHPAIGNYIRILQMNVPRTELVYEQTLELARAHTDGSLVALIERGLDKAREVTALNARRLTQSQTRSDTGDDQFDRDMDRALRYLIRALIEAEAYLRESGSLHALRVSRLKTAHFPVGHGDITAQRYEEQLHRTKALVADLRGPYADLLPMLEVELKLQAVEALIRPYGQALTARKRVTAADVRALAAELQECTRLIVARIIATWHHKPATMEALLLPLDDQQARISSIMRARRAGQGVSDDPTDDVDDFDAAGDALEGEDAEVEAAAGEPGADGVVDDAPAEAAADDAPADAARAPAGVVRLGGVGNGGADAGGAGEGDDRG